MERRKVLLIGGVLALCLVCAASLCLGFTLATASRRLAGASPSAPVASEAATATPVSMATSFPSVTPALSPLPTLSETAQISPTLALTATLPGTLNPELSPPAEVLTATEVLTGSLPLGTPVTPAALPLAQDAWCIPWNAPATYAQVLRIIDGVTIEVELDGRPMQVRYIGVDLLDYSQDEALWGRMAEENIALVGGKTVLLLKDRSESDLEGRLLRYVFAGGVFANRQMVTNGYAVAKSSPPDTSCDSLFLEAEQQAILAERGLWAPEPTPTRTIIPFARPTVSASGNILLVRVAHRGTPWQEPEEFAEIYNAGDEAVQLQGWSLRDNERHIFVFPRFVLGPGEYCRVYTDLYSPQHCGFTYNNPGPIWNNDGDCAYLKDPDGLLISTFCYD